MQYEINLWVLEICSGNETRTDGRQAGRTAGRTDIRGVANTPRPNFVDWGGGGGKNERTLTNNCYNLLWNLNNVREIQV